MYRNDISIFLQDHKENMLQDLASLIAIPSVRSEAKEGLPFGESCGKALSAMLSIAEKLGFSTENYENYMGCARLGGEAELGILGHLDVVPAGDGWKADPFTARFEDGKIIGRGVIDDKGPLIAALYALYAVKELNIPLKSGVTIYFGTDEENGSSDLAYFTSKHSLPPYVFTPDADFPVINIEKGMLRVFFEAPLPEGVLAEGGSVINAVPSYAHCIIDGETTEFHGKAAHASTPEKGDNALTKLIKALADKNIDVFKNLSELFPCGETDGSGANVKFSDSLSGDLTLVFSVAKTENSVLKGSLDIRFPLCTSKAEIMGRLEKALGEKGIKITAFEGVEPHHVPAESDFVKGLMSAYTEVTGNEAYAIAIGGGTYVHNIPGGVAFGAQFPGDDNNMHGAEEFITVENLIKSAEIYANAIVKTMGIDG